MKIGRPPHLKEDLVLVFLTVLAIAIIIVLWLSQTINKIKSQEHMSFTEIRHPDRTDVSNILLHRTSIR